MPYKSEAQRRYFNANRDKLKGEGVDVDEWNASSKGKKLPEKKANRTDAHLKDMGELAQASKDMPRDGAIAGGLGGAAIGGGLGALGGGLWGAISPGKDEEGKERSRVREALRRALMLGVPGAAIGGAGGAGAGLASGILGSLLTGGAGTLGLMMTPAVMAGDLADNYEKRKAEAASGKEASDITILNAGSAVQQLAKLAASDGDNDGLVHDGTPQERKINLKDKVKSTKVEFSTGVSSKTLKRKRKRKVHTKKAGLTMPPIQQLAKEAADYKKVLQLGKDLAGRFWGGAKGLVAKPGTGFGYKAPPKWHAPTKNLANLGFHTATSGGAGTLAGLGMHEAGGTPYEIAATGIGAATLTNPAFIKHMIGAKSKANFPNMSKPERWGLQAAKTYVPAVAAKGAIVGAPRMFDMAMESGEGITKGITDATASPGTFDLKGADGQVVKVITQAEFDDIKSNEEFGPRVESGELTATPTLSGLQALNQAGRDIQQVTSSGKRTAANIEDTTNEVSKQIETASTDIADTTGAVKDTLPRVLEGVEDATGAVSELTTGIKPIGNLATTLTSKLEDSPLGEVLQSSAESVGDFFQAAKKHVPTALYGALGTAGLYGIYKIITARNEAKKKEKEERQRLLYSRPDAFRKIGTMTMTSIQQLAKAAAQEMYKQAGPLDSAALAASNVANKALQSPLGQGALNVGANMYNAIPQGGRDMISAEASRLGGLTNQNAGDGSWKMPGFKADPSQGIGVNSSTDYQTGTGGGRMDQNAMDTQSPYGNTQDQPDQSYDELIERLSTMTPGHAGSPFSQLARGAMTGQMPTSTYPQGTPVANEYGFAEMNGEGIQDQNVDRLVPQATMNQQFGPRPSGANGPPLGPTKRNSPRLNTLPGLTPSNPNYVPTKRNRPRLNTLPGLTPSNPNYVPKKVPLNTASAIGKLLGARKGSSGIGPR
jgi:hypothetical protein